MNKISKIIVFILVCIVILISGFSLKISKAKDKIVSIDYYFYNPCRSCTDGEEFADKLKVNIEENNLGEEDEYRITIRNIAEKESDDLFKEITKNIGNEDEVEINVPLLKVNNTFIFGTEAIEKEGIGVIESELEK